MSIQSKLFETLATIQIEQLSSSLSMVLKKSRVFRAEETTMLVVLEFVLLHLSHSNLASLVSNHKILCHSYLCSRKTINEQ